MINRDLQTVLKVLKKKGVILYPTDTVWGIGCDASNFDAIERLSMIKKRKKGQPLIVLVSDLDMLSNYVTTVPRFVLDYLDTVNKPTTIIYPEAKNLPKCLLSDDGSVGIRIVKNNYLHTIIEEFKKPIVSTSANFSGEQTPNSFGEISDKLISEVDFVVSEQYGNTNFCEPSDIYKIIGNELVKIR